MITTDLTDADLITAANQALTRPGSFGYYGDLDLFSTWGLTFTQHRDSDALGRSNYRRIMEDLTALASRDGDDPTAYVDEVHCSHWAHGWVDHIAVRVLIDPDEPVTPNNITAVFRHAAETARYLREDYPVYDETDYSDLEFSEWDAYFTEEWDSMIARWDTDDGPEPTDQEREDAHEYYLSEVDSRELSFTHDDLETFVLDNRPGRTTEPTPIDPNQNTLF